MNEGFLGELSLWEHQMEYIFFLFVFYINMVQDYPIQISVINKLGQK